MEGYRRLCRTMESYGALWRVIGAYGGLRGLWRVMESCGGLCKAASQQVAAMENSEYLEIFSPTYTLKNNYYTWVSKKYL